MTKQPSYTLPTMTLDNASLHERRSWLKTASGASAGVLLGVPGLALANTAVPLAAGSVAPAQTLALDVSRTAFRQRRTAALAYWKGKAFQLGQVSVNRKYVRPQSYDFLSFALRCFFNDDQTDQANDAVLAHNRLYHGKPDVMDDVDNYYWAIGLLFQCIEFHGTQASGRLRADVQADSLRLIATWMRSHSVAAQAAEGGAWKVKGSENHHVQEVYCRWHSAKLLAESADHSSVPLSDGLLPVVHQVAWGRWLETWLYERATKGLLIEYGGEAYGATTLKGLYNVARFAGTAPNAKLGPLATMFIDLYWADALQETIVVQPGDPAQRDVVRGGAKTRVYGGAESLRGRPKAKGFHEDPNPLQQMLLYYAGLGPETPIASDVLQMVCSGIVPRAEILALLTDSDTTRRVRESGSRVLGRRDTGQPNVKGVFNILQTEGLLRYCYRTPEFVLGSVRSGARLEQDWAMISSQNRWLGAVFSSHIDARVVFNCAAEDDLGLRQYNAFWSVQKRGALIVQKLHGEGHGGQRLSKYAGAARIWVAKPGRVKVEAANGWIFLNYGTASVGLFVVSGGVRWVKDDKDTTLPGEWVVMTDDLSAVVMEVVSHQRMSHESFKARLSQVKPVLAATGELTYTSTYGDRLQLNTRYVGLPQINGADINLRPAKGLSGAVLDADWASSRVAFNYARKRVDFDFAKATVEVSNT